MKEYTHIQTQTIGTRVNYHDTVSGAFFHKFVREYHAYDRRQKEVIASLQEEIQQLQAEKEQISEERDRYMNTLSSIASYTGNKKKGDTKDKIKRQKAAISQLMLTIIDLKERLRKLTIKDFEQ